RPSAAQRHRQGRQFHQLAARQELAARPVPPALQVFLIFRSVAMDACQGILVVLLNVAVEYVGLRYPT
ncbi:MAG TPA: hypothetical protein VK980_10875, partial [Sphingomonas sp.]|nr:hypothetical protein [Sphingomonas sp.]